MKTQTQIPRVSAKLKRSTNPYTHKGETVYIYRDRENGTVAVSYDNKFDSIFDVLKEDIKPFRKSGLIKSKVKVLTTEELLFKAELNAFYDNQANVAPAKCENCGAFFDLHTARDYRNITCHILPKGLFPEVATHPFNTVFMCCSSGCYGHGNYDNKGAEDRKSMPVYPLALSRFLEFKHLLSDDRLINACEYMGIDWRGC